MRHTKRIAQAVVPNTDRACDRCDTDDARVLVRFDEPQPQSSTLTAFFGSSSAGGGSGGGSEIRYLCIECVDAAPGYFWGSSQMRAQAVRAQHNDDDALHPYAKLIDAIEHRAELLNQYGALASIYTRAKDGEHLGPSDLRVAWRILTSHRYKK